MEIWWLLYGLAPFIRLIQFPLSKLCLLITKSSHFFIKLFIFFFVQGGTLHEPIEKCKCNLYSTSSTSPLQTPYATTSKNVATTKDDVLQQEGEIEKNFEGAGELDKETAAFFNIYKSAVYESDPRTVSAVKYNTINKPIPTSVKKHYQVRIFPSTQETASIKLDSIRSI